MLLLQKGENIFGCQLVPVFVPMSHCPMSPPPEPVQKVSGSKMIMHKSRHELEISDVIFLGKFFNDSVRPIKIKREPIFPHQPFLNRRMDLLGV